MSLYESDIEKLILNQIAEQGYEVRYGPNLLDGLTAERTETDLILEGRLRAALQRINPHLPTEALEDALKQALRKQGLNLIDESEAFHELLINGVDVRYRRADGQVRTEKAWLIDFENAGNNQFLALNQFTVLENHINKRPDIVLFINGLPLVVIEVKNAADPNANIMSAFSQLQSYHATIPSLFRTNAFEVITDGWYGRAGTISSQWTRFMEWKSPDGLTIPDQDRNIQVLTLIQGMLKPEALLDIIQNFIVFDNTGNKKIKKLAAYHQYYAVNRALKSTLRASADPKKRQTRDHPAIYDLPTVEHQVKGDRRAGVVWHTQGSGKSLSMVFYSAKLVREPAMKNPTIVVLTDRNDLDQQLFDTFVGCKSLLRQTPVQSESREHLQSLLRVASGGIVFTTIQKFFPDEGRSVYPTLSERGNIVVIADEAHRSQYGFIDGFARHIRDALPKATFIGFTGTPVEKTDANTQAVFGNYVDIYDIQQAVEDGATVPIYYESRLAKISLSEADRALMDERVEELLETEELTERQRGKARWTSKEAVVGSADRLRQIATDIVNHFEARKAVLGGKGMIVCMSRRICVELYDEIIKLRPDWHDSDYRKGKIKVVMTGSSTDPVSFQPHIYNKETRKNISERLKDPEDELSLLIVRDMLLTGYDAPPLHTMYIDKPMNGHTLMQAIARVNRVFEGKAGGLIVDYIGIAQDLKEALANYIANSGRGEVAIDQEEAVAKLLEYHEILQNLFHGFDYKRYFELEDVSEKLNFILDATDYILGLEEIVDGTVKRTGKDRFLHQLSNISKAFGLAVPHERALALRDDLKFFQAIKARIRKMDERTATKTDYELDAEIRQIINDAIVSSEVVDIFDAAGIVKPNISILSDEFLWEIQNMKRKNVALELLKKLLNDEIKARGKFNMVQGKKFSEMLAEIIKCYQAGLISSAQVIEELINMARTIKKEDERVKELGLSPAELAFYDALADNKSAEEALGVPVLKQIAFELVEKIRKNTSIDWQLKASVQAALRREVKRILRHYKYPPDDPVTKEYTVSVTKVLDQAELLADYWTVEGELKE